MPKTSRNNSKQNVKPDKLINKEAAYLFLPWSCKHYPDHSEIEAYLPGRDWETIVEIPSNPGVDAELITEFIVRVINTHEKNRDLLNQAAYALELCLTGGSLKWEAEQEAEVILGRMKDADIMVKKENILKSSISK